MIKVRHVDMGRYAGKAKEIAEGKLEKRFPGIAERFRQDIETMTPEGEGRIEKACGAAVRSALASYVISRGIVSRRKTECCGEFCMTRDADVDLRDIPSRLLDVNALIPDFPEMVSALVREARKERLAEAIEETTRTAEESAGEEREG